MRKFFYLSALFAGLSAAAMGQCSQGIANTQIGACPNPVASLAVSPANSTLTPNATVQLTAVTILADGSTNVPALCAWASSNPAIATVVPSFTPAGVPIGLVTGVTSGTITASCNTASFSGTATIVVQGGSVTITQPTNGQIPTGINTQPYSYAGPGGGFQAVGGIPPYTWSVSSGALPGSMTLSTVAGIGNLAWSSAVTGSYSWTIKVTDSTPVTPLTATEVISFVVSSTSPILPAMWVRNKEATDGTYTAPAYELLMGVSGGSWVGSAPTGCTFTLGNYTTTGAGVQAAYTDVEACRTAHAGNIGFYIDRPPGIYTSVNGIVVPQTSTTQNATAFIIVRSTQDSTIAALPEPICAGGIQFNVAAATHPGLINPDCAGDAMAYQAGNGTKAVLTSVPAGAFTFANGTNSNTSNYNYAQYLYQDTCSGSTCIPVQMCNPTATGSAQCATAVGPDHWYFLDGAAYLPPNHTNRNTIMGAPATSLETAISQFATHIHWRRMWSHGDWTSLLAGSTAVQSGFEMSACYNCSLVASQISEILDPGSECHGVGVSGDFVKIDNNWIEGCSSGVFSGGQSKSTGYALAGYVPMTDTEVRRNRLTFPLQWLGNKVPAGNSIPQYQNQSLVRKNCMETKEGSRIVFDGNICENVDASGQTGESRLLQVRNTSVGTGQNYQATVNDITETNEIEWSTCQGLSIDARSAMSSGNGGGTSQVMKRVTFNNVLEFAISTSATVNAGCNGNNGVGDSFNVSPNTWPVTITENSAGTGATAVAVGVPAVGAQVFNISAGDPVTISGCTNTAFNVATHTLNGFPVPLGIGPLATVGSAPWNPATGFVVANVTVTYPWTAAANSSDSSGTCVLSNIEGGPQNFSLTHHTLITDGNFVVYDTTTAAHGANFALNNLFEDSIFTGTNGWQSAAGEGNPSETFSEDYTSLTAYKLVWPGRLNTKYNEYGNLSGFTDPNGCTGTGCNPPNAAGWYFPTTSYCTGATSTSSCIGFSGAMSASSLPLALADYHGYALRSDSTFHNAASDGNDIGAIITSIDAAENAVTYTCPYTCGSPGPFPD